MLSNKGGRPGIGGVFDIRSQLVTRPVVRGHLTLTVSGEILNNDNIPGVEHLNRTNEARSNPLRLNIDWCIRDTGKK